MASSQIREAPAARDLMGPALMIVAMLCFVILDAILKHLVTRHSGFFLSWGRCLVQALLVGALVPFLGGVRTLATAHPWLQVVRGACIVVTSVAMIVASRTMPLTEIYVIAFASPLIATMIATVVLGEKATALQWSLIVGGFLGVMIALNPTAPTASLILILPLIQAAGNGVYHVLTRICARSDAAEAQLFHAGLHATLMLGVLLPWTFVAMPAGDWVLLAGGSVLVTIGHFLLIKAFTLAPTARVSPMVYFQIVWATLIGYWAFGDRPSASTIIGGAIIITCGVLLIRSRS